MYYKYISTSVQSLNALLIQNIWYNKSSYKCDWLIASKPVHKHGPFVQVAEALLAKSRNFVLTEICDTNSNKKVRKTILTFSIEAI